MVRLKKTAVALVLLAAAAISLPAPAGALDTVVRNDGSVLQGTVVGWTPKYVRVVTQGLRLDVPIENVADVQIEGAEGCERVVVEIRSHMDVQRYDKAADTLVSAMNSSEPCAALGRVAIELLDASQGTLNRDQLKEIALASGEFPEVGSFLVSSRFEMDDRVLIEAGVRSLMRSTPENFERARAGLVQVYKRYLDRAVARNNQEAIVEALAGIAELYDRSTRQPIADIEEFHKNHNRSSVDRLSHAVELIPLPDRFQEAEQSLEYLDRLAQTGMQSIQDQVRGRLERYFHQQGMSIEERFRQTGDYPAFQQEIQRWKAMIPQEILSDARIRAVAAQLDELAMREGNAFNELTRLRRLAMAKDEQFVNEIDSQLVRFRNSVVWTDKVREEMAMAKAFVLTTPTPSPTPLPAPPAVTATPDAPAQPTPSPTPEVDDAVKYYGGYGGT